MSFVAVGRYRGAAAAWVLLAMGLWSRPALATYGGAPAGAMMATSIAGTFAVLDVPGGLDTAAADAGTLARYGFPPRPSAVLAPEAYRSWRQATQDMERIVPQLLPVAVHHGPVRDRRLGVNNAPATSSNWSGFVAAAAAFNFGAQSLTQIYGDWTVPVSQPAFGACKQTPDGNAVFSSTWVGLDGNGSADVLQAGTESDAVCSQGKVGAYQGAWYEWYPFNEVRVTNLTVAPGSAMYVYVWATGAASGHAYIANKTTHKAVSVAFSAPPGVSLFGNSAEWIVERPTVGGVATNLTNYVQEFVAGAQALDAQGNQYNPGNVLVQGRQPALAISMTDANQQVISVPTLLGQSSVWFADQGSAQKVARK